MRTASCGEAGLGSRIIGGPYPIPLPRIRYGDSDSLVGDCEWPSGWLGGCPCGVADPYGEAPLPAITELE